MPARCLPVLLAVALSLPAAAQPAIEGGLLIGSGGPDGGLAESYIAGTLGAAMTTGRLRVSAGAELGAASRRVGDGRYVLDTEAYDPLVPGGPPCRDLQTGRTVSGGACEASRSVAAAAVGAGLEVPGVPGLSVGAGYRLGFQPGPTVTAGYTLGEGPGLGLRIEGVVSQRLTGLGTSLRFGW